MPEPIVTTPDTDNADSISFEIDIAAPPSRVFTALIDPAQLMQWFNDATCPVKYWKMDAQPGGAYSYETEKTSIVINGIRQFKCYGEILEIDPPRLLVYTWIGNWHVDKQIRTVVRWDLTPTPAGTHVRVTHSGLAQEPVARKDYSGGWVGVIQNLKTFTEKGKD